MGEDQPEHLRKIFIGGLDYVTTDESMRTYFSDFGEIVDVIVMRHPQTKKSRGFGFVTFGTSVMVDFVMKNRPHKLDGRTIDVKRVVPKCEIGKPESNVAVRKVFVGGVRDDVEENDLIETFGVFGNVLTVSIPVLKDTNKPRGFAFVEFEDYDAVDKAVLHKNIILKGKRVEVKKALRKDQLQNGSENAMGGGGGWNGNSGDDFGASYNNSWAGNNEGNSNNRYGATQSYVQPQGQYAGYTDASAAVQAWTSQQQYAAAYGAAYGMPTASYAAYGTAAQPSNVYGTQPTAVGGYGTSPPAPGPTQHSTAAPPTPGGYSAPAAPGGYGAGPPSNYGAAGGQWYAGGAPSPTAPQQALPNNNWQSSGGPVRNKIGNGLSNLSSPYTTGKRF